MKFTLIRMAEGDGYTLGRLEDAEQRQVCVVAERAWVDKNGDGIGDTNESRIPAGTYTCRRDIHGKSGPHPYEVWEICGVPGRSEVHMHRGNDPRIHSKGCPLIGTDFGANGTVTESGKAFEKWMQVTAGPTEITLTVLDIPASDGAAHFRQRFETRQ